ncbi:ATP-binding protein [Streptomyces sp. NPDC001852]|uniref:ATP-binding protein n=1 Tax=Streptomyces sp. NPDC001852 TaxID=3364619 RepID=UPI0036BD08A4
MDPAAAAGTVETLALVVSELSTDALRHGGGRYTLELTFTAEAVNAAVSDLNPAPSRERAPDLDGRAGGFGWPMVRRLTSKVTIAPRPGQGKARHVRLPRRPRRKETPTPQTPPVTQGRASPARSRFKDDSRLTTTAPVAGRGSPGRPKLTPGGQCTPRQIGSAQPPTSKEPAARPATSPAGPASRPRGR